MKRFRLETAKYILGVKAGQCGSGLKNERKGGSKSNWRDRLEVVQAGPEGYVTDSEFWSKFHSKF